MPPLRAPTPTMPGREPALYFGGVGGGVEGQDLRWPHRHWHRVLTVVHKGVELFFFSIIRVKRLVNETLRRRTWFRLVLGPKRVSKDC